MGPLFVSILFVPKKRPFLSEGHLRLPTDLAPADPDRHKAPFDRGGRTRIHPVPDDRLAALDVRAGDRVILGEDRTPEYGDLALVEADGRAALWKVFPEGATLALGDGRERVVVAAAAVHVRGVVLGVLRALRGD